MVKCRDCGHEISARAKACPHCGRPVKRISLLGGCAVIALVMLIGVCFFSEPNRIHSVGAASTAPAQTLTPTVPAMTISDAGMTSDEKAAFLKTKAGRLWKKHGGAWSPDDCRAIVKGRIYPGMAADMVRAAWGSPDHVNSSIYVNGRHEQWVYNNANYVYFENGVMTSLQQSK